MPRNTVKKRANMAKKRYGSTTKGTAKRKRGKTTVRPRGNPLKGKIGVKIKRTF